MPTFSDLDLGTGVTLGHVFDASHYLRHGGRFVWSAGEGGMLRLAEALGLGEEDASWAPTSRQGRDRSSDGSTIWKRDGG